MRRKTFEVLFEPGAGMAAIAKQPSLWRSAFYFTLSFSFFGVATNCWLLDSPLEVRFGIIIATVLIAGTALTLYGFLLHGIMETFGALAGDPVGLICLLGYTTLPFLLLTPGALLAGRMGFNGLPLLGVDAVSSCAVIGGSVPCRCLPCRCNRSVQPVFAVYCLCFTVAGLPDAVAVNKI